MRCAYGSFTNATNSEYDMGSTFSFDKSMNNCSVVTCKLIVIGSQRIYFFLGDPHEISLAQVCVYDWTKSRKEESKKVVRNNGENYLRAEAMNI